MRFQFLQSRTAHHDDATGQVFDEPGCGFAIGNVAVEAFRVASVQIARDAFGTGRPEHCDRSADRHSNAWQAMVSE
jgi:hypothetical protein